MDDTKVGLKAEQAGDGEKSQNNGDRFIVNERENRNWDPRA